MDMIMKARKVLVTAVDRIEVLLLHVPEKLFFTEIPPLF
jgi:hypothetical protein